MRIRCATTPPQAQPRREMERASLPRHAFDPEAASHHGHQALAEIDRPSPVPPYSRVIELSPWANASKITPCLSAGMPIPVSLTSK